MKQLTVDGNTAVAYVSYAFTEIAAIYPITPSSPMAEQADLWASQGKKNLFGDLPNIIQMQSESGVAGVMHGAATCGALATTYTCSQGLLLALPNMYKLAGELLPCVFHVSARALSTHALSIFGDHQDVMACRECGFIMLASASVQEAADLAFVAHLGTLKTSIPVLHFFDGFRTSHEFSKIELPDYEEMLPYIDRADIERFRARALNPEKPMQRGTAQNPDIYFQNREAANRLYLDAPIRIQSVMDKAAELLGRQYQLFDYFGADDAKHVAVLMGSGASVMEETVEKLCELGRKVGVVKVRLFRPFSSEHFLSVLPQTCEKIAVLDRSKEAGALGEALYLDVCAALAESGRGAIRVFGGRYGLGSKEFTPTSCLAVFENLEKTEPKNHFTVGIYDDCTHLSLPMRHRLDADSCHLLSCIFYGLGSDGTVGSNKDTVKIVGDNTELYAQAYFCYDSKKSGGATVSHLRFSTQPIRSSYLIETPDFVACHNPSYLTRFDMLSGIKDGGTFLLNCPWETQNELLERIPAPVKRQILTKKLRFYTVNATALANELGLQGRTGVIMQAVFFFLQEKTLLPYAKSCALLKDTLSKRFARKGERIINSNLLSIDRALESLQEVYYSDEWNADDGTPMLARPENEYFENFMQPILTLRGNELPVSAFSPDGSVPTDTIKFEKHGVPFLLPVWIAENCIQCNRCAFACPHAVIRPFLIDENETCPDGFITKTAVGVKGARFRIQISPHDCMGCSVCADVCPPKEKALVMRPASESMPAQGRNWEFAQNVKRVPAPAFSTKTVKGSQFKTPLFEFSYACAGCGETPYIKLLTQLFGEKLLIANATGCSSIYGGSAPSCPYAKNENGRGPAWANSLFEDNAEFGLGMQLAWKQRDGGKDKSTWIIGGDGWAYDIGYGGLDHVLSLDEKVNILVLDSEVYSNTGGQQSKATPLGATARFASNGKQRKKKQLGLMAMTYGTAYVAQVSMGADMQQCLNAFLEAEAYDGPSLIIAYSPCIEQGFPMQQCMSEEKRAVESGYFPLFRFNPALKNAGENPLRIDSKAPSLPIEAFLSGENRFSLTQKTANHELLERIKKDAQERASFLQFLYDFYEKILK